ncbi:MAG: glycosyltransferase, partial [Victivallaceae bacterium]|nr:glycosyltransferase [Victivallaceae bacterium]
MNVALVYDRINKWGGAERVLLALHELFPDAPLYTAVYDPVSAPWAHVFEIHPSFLQSFPFARHHHEYFSWLTPLAFESFNFDSYDLVISVTSADAKGIITKPGTRHLCYCLTPTRYLWSHHDVYFQNSFFQFISKPMVRYLQKWDKVACSRPDSYIAISKTVQTRIQKYYKRDSKVIYPPAKIIKKTVCPEVKRKSLPDIFFLVVSRLVPYKKVDLAIRSCNKLQLPLVVVGTGSEEKRLKSLAGPTIQFKKNLTDEELAWYYQHCTALIMPQEEDFGLSGVEAQSFGKQVIAYAKGGATETVIAGKTGVLFTGQTVDA